jgi:uncharacterized protein (TIGR03083 family)
MNPAIPPTKVDTVELFPTLSVELVRLLAELEPADWLRSTSCPGWTVHDLASHLLGVEVGNVSVLRDGWRPETGPAGDEGMDEWNQRWVDACRRMSPRLLVDLLAVAGDAYARHVASRDLDAMGGPVGWATGDQPAPVWLDVAREYMERCVHQGQIRAATGRAALPTRLVAPAVAVAVHALPVALASVGRPPGTTVVFRLTTDGGDAWTVTRGDDAWVLSVGAVAAPACEVRTSLAGAVARFVRDAGAPAPTVTGDAELGRAVASAKAILG